jgi:hypothetical protein
VSYLALAIGLVPVVGTAIAWLWWRDRRAARDAEAAASVKVGAAIDEFRVEAAQDVLDRAAESAEILREESAREAPNADLARDRAAVRERLLRAAHDAGGDAARAELERLLAAQDARDARAR